MQRWFRYNLTAMAPKVAAALPAAAPKAKARVPALRWGLPPLRNARSEEQPSFPPIKMPKCLQNLRNHDMLTPDNPRRYHGFKDNEADRVAYFLLHTDEATRDEMFRRLLYHVHPRTVYKIRCCYGAEKSRMQMKLAHRSLEAYGPWRRGETPRSQGVLACSDRGIVHG